MCFMCVCVCVQMHMHEYVQYVCGRAICLINQIMIMVRNTCFSFVSLFFFGLCLYCGGVIYHNHILCSVGGVLTNPGQGPVLGVHCTYVQ